MLAENLPPGVTVALPQIGLIFVGVVIERHYISRVTAFTNALALITHVATQSNVGFWFGVYADLGLFMGLAGMIAYLTEKSLPTEYYLVSLFLYSGLSVGAVILLPDQWVIGLIGAAIVTVLIGLLSPSNVTLMYTDRLDGAVYQYARGRIVEHVDYESGYQARIDLLEAIRNE